MFDRRTNVVKLGIQLLFGDEPVFSPRVFRGEKVGSPPNSGWIPSLDQRLMEVIHFTARFSYSQKCEWVFQIFPFLRVIKSITCKFLRVDLIWKTCSLFCHFIFLLVAFSILLVTIYATSKKLLVAKKF